LIINNLVVVVFVVAVVVVNVGNYISVSRPRSSATSTGLVHKAVGSRVVGRKEGGRSLVTS
jgi:hypothetical protein